MQGIAMANGKEAARRCLAGAALTAALLGLSAIAQAGTLDSSDAISVVAQQ